MSLSPTPSSLPVLKVAVVGHTNTGKTSLLRTLARDATFGEVSDRPATTRHVEGATLMVQGRGVMELYDTPGLEDSIALLDHLDQLRGGRRTEGVETVRQFLESPAAHERFGQEAKAIRQVLASDVALYVIDARDRVLGKHRDELEIFTRCAKPIVPVLNFTAGPEAQTALWREHLSRANLHAVAEFDTVVLDEHSEQRLLEKMRTLLDSHRESLDALIRERRDQRGRLIHGSASLIADLLIDAAAHVMSVPAADRAEVARAMERLKQRIREREQRCVEGLLELHRFRAADVRPGDLPLAEGRWGIDLFSPAAMKQFGVRTGSAAAAGAMVGLTVDAMVGGMTLGAATALGAAIGAVIGLGSTHGKRFIDQARGRSELRCDDATLRLLMLRQTALVAALLRRGHASMAPIQMAAESRPGQPGPPASGHATALPPMKPPPKELPAELEDAKLRPQWSALNEPEPMPLFSGPSRQIAQERLAIQIQKMIT